MSKVYTISDLHFGHKAIADKRGFSDVDEHDDMIIRNWNSVITKRDVVIVPGDITMEKGDYSILDMLNGIKKIVLGNHDLPQHTKNLMRHVNNVSGALKYKGYIITHIPIHPSEIRRFRGNIHGHIHDNVIRRLWMKDKRYINVSCERLGYTPVLFDKITK